jgi:hypothetical protein
MSTNEFELAFNLLHEAAGRMEEQHYGSTEIRLHNHGPIRLTSLHHYIPGQHHTLTLLAYDNHGLMAAVEATATDLNATPNTRIKKVRAGDLTFHATPTDWTYQAHGRHTYLLTAGVGDAPMWTLTVDDNPPIPYEDLEDALNTVLNDFEIRAA